jgi:hypothetical protein
MPACLNSMVRSENIYPIRLFVLCAQVYALLTGDTIVSSLVRIAKEVGPGDLVPAQIQLKMTSIAPFGMVMLEIAG